MKTTPAQPQLPVPTFSALPTSQPVERGLFAQWQVVDGRLTCRWLKHPD